MLNINSNLPYYRFAHMWTTCRNHKTYWPHWETMYKDWRLSLLLAGVYYNNSIPYSWQQLYWTAWCSPNRSSLMSTRDWYTMSFLRQGDSWRDNRPRLSIALKSLKGFNEIKYSLWLASNLCHTTCVTTKETMNQIRHRKDRHRRQMNLLQLNKWSRWIVIHWTMWESKYKNAYRTTQTFSTMDYRPDSEARRMWKCRRSLTSGYFSLARTIYNGYRLCPRKITFLSMRQWSQWYRLQKNRLTIKRWAHKLQTISKQSYEQARPTFRYCIVYVEDSKTL